jgi:8-oxo-dGTP pyrophosphatase MutT (NUDIX family)
MRDEVGRLVRGITAWDRLEEEHLAFAERWIGSGVEIFRVEKPDKPRIHLVSYFVVLDGVEGKFLLVDHRKSGLWLPPGGHVEPGEHPQEAVRREVREELGVEADFVCEEPIFLTVTETVGNVAKHTDVSLWYVLRGKVGQEYQYDRDEFYAIGWFGAEEIPYGRCEPHMKRFVSKVR